jgi:hypothetical protein
MGGCVVCVRGTARDQIVTRWCCRGECLATSRPLLAVILACAARLHCILRRQRCWKVGVCFWPAPLATDFLASTAELRKFRNRAERQKSAETCNSVKVTYFCTTK